MNKVSGQRKNILLVHKRSMPLRTERKPHIINALGCKYIFSYNLSTEEILKVCKIKSEFFDLSTLYKAPGCVFIPAKDHEDARKKIESFLNHRDNESKSKP